MLIAFQRTIGTISISMIADEDHDWDVLKHTMCTKWVVEDLFNRHRIWDRLRRGEIVTIGQEMFRIWDTERQGEYADDIFQGRHVEVTMEDLP